MSLLIVRSAHSQERVPYITPPRCMRPGGEEEATISRDYQDQAIAVLRQLMLMTPALSPEVLQARFTEHTRLSIELHDGDATVSLALIRMRHCPSGSRDTGGVYAIYILDWQEEREVSEIDFEYENTFDFHWERDHWVGVVAADPSSSPYLAYRLWVIAKQNDEWTRIQEMPLGVGAMADNQFDIVFRDDEQVIRFTQSVYGNFGPCIIDESYYQDYFPQATVVTVFQYNGRIYDQVEQKFMPTLLPRPERMIGEDRIFVNHWRSLCAPGYDATNIPSLRGAVLGRSLP